MMCCFSVHLSVDLCADGHVRLENPLDIDPIGSVLRGAGTGDFLPDAPLRLLLKNYKLSDDIAFRFGNRDWSEWPLRAETFAEWVNQNEVVIKGTGAILGAGLILGAARLTVSTSKAFGAFSSSLGRSCGRRSPTASDSVAGRGSRKCGP